MKEPPTFLLVWPVDRSNYLLKVGALFLLLVASGCLKEIELDVPSDTGELVVEAYYFGDRDSALARISRSTGYFAPTLPPVVSNAVVILEEVETGNQDTLRWRDSLYMRVGGSVRPQPTHHYRLKVQVDDENLTSQAMPLLETVRILALIDTFLPARGPIPAGYRLIGISQDPPRRKSGLPAAYLAQ